MQKIIKETHAMRTVCKSYSRSGSDPDRNIKAERNEQRTLNRYMVRRLLEPKGGFCLAPQPSRLSPTASQSPVDHTRRLAQRGRQRHTTQSRHQSLRHSNSGSHQARLRGRRKKYQTVLIIHRHSPPWNKSGHKLWLSNTIFDHYCIWGELCLVSFVLPGRRSPPWH